jgi:hypothetical protein
MTRTVLTGAVVALLVAVLAIGGSALGISTIWPVLLAVAVATAARNVTLGRVAAFVIGAVLGWVLFAVYAGTLPQTASSRAILAVVAVLVLTALAAVTGDRVSLAAGLIGYAAFAALYEPVYADTPTLFLSQSPIALLTVLFSGALGVAAVELSALLTSGSSSFAADETEIVEGGAL